MGSDIAFFFVLFAACFLVFYIVKEKGFFKPSISYGRLLFVNFVVSAPPALFIVAAFTADFLFLIRCGSGAIAIIWLIVGCLYLISLTQEVPGR